MLFNCFLSFVLCIWADIYVEWCSNPRTIIISNIHVKCFFEKDAVQHLSYIPHEYCAYGHIRAVILSNQAGLS